MARRCEPLWAEVRIGLEILEAGTGMSRAHVLNQPFAVIGRLADSHIRIDDRAVSARHAYLHADARGLFIVDLGSRTGIRFDGNLVTCGWLKLGDMIEIAGHFIRLVQFEVKGQQAPFSPGVVSPLADAPGLDLCGLTLEPVGQRGISWTLRSELVFVGRGDSCGIRLNHANIARTHFALYRTTTHAYLISLPSHPTQVDGEIVRTATPLRNGSLINFGQTRFTARISPVSSTASKQLERAVPAELKNLPAFSGLTGLPSTNTSSPSFSLELIPPEARDAVLGWMLGTLHAGQNEITRRQDELQHSLTLILKHLQTATNSRLDDQAGKLEALTAEIARLNAQQPTTLSPPPLPLPEPTDRPARDLPPAPEIEPARSLETAAWLLRQIDKLEHANKFSLKSLLTRRTTRKDSSLAEADSSTHSCDKTGSNGGGEEAS